MIEYLKNNKIKELIENAPSYQKSALTGLRKIKFSTYVKDGLGVRLETEQFLPGVVIARNPGQIGVLNGEPIFNEWPISLDVAAKNYGENVINNLTDEISYHKKIATIKAIKVTDEIMHILGIKLNPNKSLNDDENILFIKVSWSPEPMKAKLGDFITDGGYSISAHDMATTYECVSSITKKIKP